MQVFNRSQTADLLPYATIVEALEEGMRDQVSVPERQHHDVCVAGEPTRTLITMPAWDSTGLVGVKLVNVVPGNAARGQPAISAAYVLFDARNGSPAALLDGTELTARRTAGVAALAGKHLSRPDAEVHLIVGAGAVASHLAPAYREVRRFTRTLIWARRHDRAVELARGLRLLGIDASAVEDLEEGVRQADVVSCATMAEQPILLGAWLRPGTHVDLMGSYRPGMREADDHVLQGATIYVDSLPGALTDAGELSDPISRKVIRREDVSGDLQALCMSPPERTSLSRTVFKSVGNARWDFHCAAAAWRDNASESRT